MYRQVSFGGKKYPKGIFAMCWRLIMDGKMEKEDEELFRKIEAWFVENSLEDSCHEYIKYMESEGKMFSVHADWAKAVRWVKKCCRR